jgi:polyisoprenyl-teichoic acid--peptidoglycan teichoic acid transferase
MNVKGNGCLLMKKTQYTSTKKPSQGITFIKYFIITFIVGVLVLTPLSSVFEKVADIQIFGESETNLMDEMPIMVDEDSIFFEAFQDKNRVNVLLVGLNQNLADTIMVASFDYDAKHVDLISIPRDTYYYRKGYYNPGALKVNAIYQNTYEPLETAMVVSEILLGMPIHFYTRVDYEGIVKIVDTMGGVPMDIPFDMKYSDPTDTPPLYINIPKGYQLLDGEHSVQFLRYRKGYTEGDIGRVKAQQEFMKSAFKQMLGFDLPKITKVIFNNVESDVNLSTATKIASKAIGMNGESIKTYVMPHTLQDGAPYFVYPDSKGISEVITEIYSIEPESTSEEKNAAE